MDASIAKLKSTTFCGRRFSRKQLYEIQQTVGSFPALSRHELAQTICEHLQWQTPKGSHRFNACLHLLESLEQLGVLQLPEKISQQRGAQKPIVWTHRSAPQASIECELEQLMPLALQVVSEKPEIREWNELVDRHHYLGYRRPIGLHLRYFIVDGQGRRLGALMFCYAVRSLPCRDEWIGWQDQKHKKHLDLVVSNNRFLILPWVRVKNLASKSLSMACRRLADDWCHQHAYRPVLIETFVDAQHFDASCYRAANWHCIGRTRRRGKSPKDVYLYPLIDEVREVLLHGPRPVSKRSVRAAPKILPAADPFVQLWQNLIGIVAQVAEDFDPQWQQRQRVLNSLLIMLFIFRLVFSANRQGYAITLAQLWEQCRMMDIALPQQRPVAPSAMCKARTKLDENIFKTLQTRLLKCIDLQSEDADWKGHRIHAVDGSKINLPRALIKAGYRCPSDNAYYPQGTVSCLYRLKTQLPVDFDVVAHGDERRLARSHLCALKAADVVVYDRGYYSYEMLYEHVGCGIEGVFRMQKNIGAVFDRFIHSAQIDQVVEVCASREGRDKVRARHGDVECRPIRVRLVKYTVSGTTYTLATTLLDVSRYPIADLSDLYHARWGIEELYKVSKNLLSIEDFHAASERGVRQELFAHFVLITLTRLFSNHSEIQLNPDGCDDQRAFKANFKNALTVIGKNLETLLLKQADMVSEVLNQIIVGISWCRQRKRPNRSYPRRSRKPSGKWKPGKPAKTTSG